MIYSNKETKYIHGGHKILVKDSIRLINSRTKVYINGEKILDYKHPYFQLSNLNTPVLDREIDILEEKFRLKVKSGYHLHMLYRCHIYIDHELIGGDKGKELYMPPVWLCCPMKFFALIGFISLFIKAYVAFTLYENARLIEDKIMTNDFRLYEKDIVKYFSGEDRNKILIAKKELWQRTCLKDKDDHCRLRSYIGFFEGNIDDKLKYSLIGCSHGSILSCYVAYISKPMNIKHSRYNEISSRINTHCREGKELSEREIDLCYYFSEKFFRESGDGKVYRDINSRLCKLKYKLSCDSMDFINKKSINFKSFKK